MTWTDQEGAKLNTRQWRSRSARAQPEICMGLVRISIEKDPAGQQLSTPLLLLSLQQILVRSKVTGWENGHGSDSEIWCMKADCYFCVSLVFVCFHTTYHLHIMAFRLLMSSMLKRTTRTYRKDERSRSPFLILLNHCDPIYFMEQWPTRQGKPVGFNI